MFVLQRSEPIVKSIPQKSDICFLSFTSSNDVFVVFQEDFKFSKNHNSPHSCDIYIYIYIYIYIVRNIIKYGMVTTRKILFSDGLLPTDTISSKFFYFPTDISKWISSMGTLIFSTNFTHGIGIRRKSKFPKTKELYPSRLSQWCFRILLCLLPHLRFPPCQTRASCGCPICAFVLLLVFGFIISICLSCNGYHCPISLWGLP